MSYNIMTESGPVPVEEFREGDYTMVDNSNSDLDLIEGDGIGGDNSIDSNEAAAEQFSEEVASGEDAVAPNSEVNAVWGTDGEAVAVAASEEEIEDSDAMFYTTQQDQDSTNSQDSQQPTQQPTQEMRASYQQLLTRLQGQQQQSNDSAASPALAVGSLVALGIAGYWVMAG